MARGNVPVRYNKCVWACVCVSVYVCLCMDTSTWMQVCIHVFPSPLCVACCAWRKRSCSSTESGACQNPNTPVQSDTLHLPPSWTPSSLERIFLNYLLKLRILRCLCPLVVFNKWLFIFTFFWPPHLTLFISHFEIKHFFLKHHKLNASFFFLHFKTVCASVCTSLKATTGQTGLSVLCRIFLGFTFTLGLKA